MFGGHSAIHTGWWESGEGGGAASILMWDLYPVMLTSACQHVRGDGDNMQILCKDDVRSKTLSGMTFSAAVNVAWLMFDCCLSHPRRASDVLFPSLSCPKIITQLVNVETWLDIREETYFLRLLDLLFDTCKGHRELSVKIIIKL